MDELHSNRQVRITTGLMGLFLFGFDTVVATIAFRQNTPIVLIPFVIATLVSFGAIWWAQRCNGELDVSPPFGAEKITPDSSHARPAKPVN